MAERWTWREPHSVEDSGLQITASGEDVAGSECPSSSSSEAGSYSSYSYSSYSSSGKPDRGAAARSSCSRREAVGELLEQKHSRGTKRPRVEAASSGVERLPVWHADIPFLLGSGGLTLQRIGAAAGCGIELEQGTNVVELRGDHSQRSNAKRYLRSMLASRRGALRAEEEVAAGHCTAVPVRSEAVGMVLGKGGRFLRSLERQSGALMCMGDHADPDAARTHETIVILGERRARRAAQLLVMSSVEIKHPGDFTNATRASGRTYDEAEQDGDWGTCTTELSGDSIAFVLGRKANTLKKLEKASSCIMQIVHTTLFVSGLKADRARAKDYLGWLFDQLDGPMCVNVRGRSDVSVLDIPQDAVAFVFGIKRDTLSRLEAEFGVLAFFATGKKERHGHTQRLHVFGSARGRLGFVLDAMRVTELVCPGYFSRGVQHKVSDKQALDTERLVLGTDVVGRLHGKKGDTVRLLSVASGAFLQYLGGICWVGGTLEERRRCLDYVRWVRDQVHSRIVVDARGRSDVTEVHLPAKVAESVAGRRCEELRRVEKASNCLLLLAYDPTGGRRLCIFSREEGDRFSDGGRSKAEHLVNKLIHAKLWEHSQLQRQGGLDQVPAVADAERDEDSAAGAGSASGSDSGKSAWNRVDWDS